MLPIYLHSRHRAGKQRGRKPTKLQEENVATGNVSVLWSCLRWIQRSALKCCSASLQYVRVIQCAGSKNEVYLVGVNQ